MRFAVLPALIVAVIVGGLTLFGLLWLWFYFEQGGSGSQYQSGQDDGGYSSQNPNGYGGGYNGYGNGYNGYGGYSNAYNSGQGQPIYPYARRRLRYPCYNPCY